MTDHSRAALRTLNLLARAASRPAPNCVWLADIATGEGWLYWRLDHADQPRRGHDESDIIASDWTQLMIGMRDDIRIVLLRERFMDNLQFGFIVHVRVDFAATRDGAFRSLTASRSEAAWRQQYEGTPPKRRRPLGPYERFG